MQPAGRNAAARTLFGRPLPVVLVAAEKAIGAVAAAAGSLVGLLILVDGRLTALTRLMNAELAEDPHDLILTYLASRLPQVGPDLALSLAVGFAVFALLLAVEAVGFWFAQPWAEILIIIETGLLIPVEVYEILRTPQLLQVGSLAINVLIVAYVARRYAKSRARSENW